MRDGVIALRTDDHSYVEQLRQQGIISTAQLHTHRFRNYVTRCLGGMNNHPVAELGGPFPLEEGDTILLCSDGFWGALSERTMVDAIYKSAQPLVSVVNTLSAQAENNSQPESDNVTVIAIRWVKKSLNIQPADISMSLADNAASQKQPRGDEGEVREAIDNLRKLVEDIDNEE
jgi:serine/threonine protein phosphatase PrpC